MPSMRRSNGPSSGVWRTIRTGTGVSRKSASPGRAERHQLDVVPAPRERLGDLDRVHDPAARLDRVGEHRDPHADRPSGEPRRGGVRGRDDHARGAQRLLLAAGVLRVVRRCRRRARSPGCAWRAWRAPRRARPRGRRASRGRSRRRAGRSRAVALGGLLEATAGAPRGRPSGAAGPACTPPPPGRRSCARRRRRRGPRCRRSGRARARGSSSPRGRASRRSRGRAACRRSGGRHLGLERVDVRRLARRRPRTRRRRASGGSRTARRRSPSRRTRRRRACR